MKILKIAVTGSAGSGKSLVCRRLGELGAAALDCDQIARQVVEPGTKGFEKVAALFGSGAVLPDGTLDRAEIRRVIIRDPGKKKALEAIVHPLVGEELVRQMESAGTLSGKKTVAVEVPLLFETGMQEMFDLSIVVLAGNATLVERIVHRDGVSAEDASGILDLQLSEQEKASRADFVVHNTGALPELFDMVDNLFFKIEKEYLTT